MGEGGASCWLRGLCWLAGVNAGDNRWHGMGSQYAGSQQDDEGAGWRWLDGCIMERNF
jgi:hypothetical protein